jgi:hypothetical protein
MAGGGPRRQRQRAAAGVCLLAFLPFSASATTEYAVELGESAYSVKNPFQFPDGTASPLNRSDTLRSTDIGAAVRVPLPSDRSALTVGATASQKKYDALTQLNRTDKQLDVRYQWEYTHLLRGTLRHRFDERLYNYYGGSFTNREVPRVQQDTAEIALRITPELEMPLTYTRSSLRYQDAALSERYNLEDQTIQLALTYTAGSRSTVTVGIRQTQVNFPQRTAADVAAIDSGYTDREAFIAAEYHYSARTTLVGRIGALDRRFATLGSRNSTLVATELSMDYQYSPITTLHLRGYRRPQGNDQADQRLYVIATGIEGQVDWQATPKTRFIFASAYGTQSYQNFLSLPGAAPSTGTDQYQRVTFGMNYLATPRLIFRMEGLRERYQPDAANAVATGGNPAGFGRSLLRLGLSYTFENMFGLNRAQQQLDQMRTDTIR